MTPMITAKPPTLTNIDFLGRGYDVYRGNPHSDSMDLGFQSKVIDLTYNTVSYELENLNVALRGNSSYK